MGSGVYDAIVAVIVWQIVIAVSDVTLIKAKLQNLHIWITGFIYQLANSVGHETKILRYNLLAAQTPFDGAEEIHARSFFPVTICCRIAAVRYGEVLVKCTEMVDTNVSV